MFVSPIKPNFNSYQNCNGKLKSNVNFTSVATAAEDVVESKFFSAWKKHVSTPLKGVYDKFTEKLARGFGKILDTDAAVKIIEKTNKYPKLKDGLVSHLCVLGSVVLSGFYIKRTLSNDKLDPQKKKTLAINQAVVWGLSTVMGYTFDKAIDKKFNKLIDKFKIINAGEKDLEKYVTGINIAKKVMIFDVVYRYIAPVLVTPIANKIGNRLQEKSDAKAKANLEKI